MKKRVILLFLCMILAVSLILPCGALSVAPPFEISSYSLYAQYIISAYLSGRVPDNFVHYRQISALGKFEKYESPSVGKFRYCTYRLSDHFDHDYLLYISQNPPIFQASNSVVKTDVKNVDDLSHMLYLKSQQQPGVITYVVVGRVKYYYRWTENPDGRPFLICVIWQHGKNYYKLGEIFGYPAGQDTLVGRLLNLETAEAAVNELMADVDGDYEMPAEDWHLIVPRILGVITFITLLTVGIRRSKKKKAALAGGGEDGMDDAGEDVESANKSDSGGAKISGGENADISRDDTVPNPPTASG